ncbi:MAG: hypothetical protein OEO84_04660 [Betaproteobacteria bacterium]|nr:hypothetical protein [Betaproteobacteria bacterium]
MSAPDRPAAQPPHDPIQDLAEKIYVQLCGRIYAAGGEKPQPRAVAQLCFKLAETFIAANYEFNPTAVAARAAKDKASVKIDSVQIDFGPVDKG